MVIIKYLHKLPKHRLCALLAVTRSMVGVALEKVVGADLVDHVHIALDPVFLEILVNDSLVAFLESTHFVV